MSEPVSSAVASEFVSRATSFLTGKCREYRSVKELINRLEMLCVKIKSAVEVSKGFDIHIKPLNEWQEKLNESVCEADEALINFDTEIFLEMPNQTIEGGSSSRDPSMQEEGSDDATLANPASNLREAITRQVDQEAKLPLIATTFEINFQHLLPFCPFLVVTYAIAALARILKSQKILLGQYLDNAEQMSKLKKTVEKLEKMAGDIGNFIKLLKLQSKHNMRRKRKISARSRQSQGFIMVISLKVQTYALFCHREDPHLLVIKLFPANCNIPTGITHDISVGFIM